MKKSLLIIFVSSVFLGGCAQSQTNNPEISQDSKSAFSQTQLETGDNLIANQTNSPDLTGDKNERSTTTVGTSGVTVMKDGFGNTVETRFFGDHPRILSVVVRTGADGEKTALVYGHNGDRRQLPKYKIADALIDEPNRIADVAGIWEGRKKAEPAIPPMPTYAPETVKSDYTTAPTVSEPVETKKEAGETQTTNPPTANQIPSNPKEPLNNATSTVSKSSEK